MRGLTGIPTSPASMTIASAVGYLWMGIGKYVLSWLLYNSDIIGEEHKKTKPSATNKAEPATLVRLKRSEIKASNTNNNMNVDGYASRPSKLDQVTQSVIK
tara:strand:+ start:1756 stop:2058 length:303 start_codon:yes stop_codon:yes gene_type:complete